MKRKFVLRAGAVLLAACFEMVGIGADTQVIVLAAEIPEAEEAAEASTDNTEFQSEGDLNAEVSLPQDSESECFRKERRYRRKSIRRHGRHTRHGRWAMDF